MEHIRKRTLSILLTLVMLFSLVLGMSGTAYADSGSDYTFSIPSSLTVQNAGENAAGSISVTALTANKKLTVTAASANSWALKSGDNSVGYSMSRTSWEFTATGSEAFSITVDDYSTKPAGTYTDTVTFTANVEDQAITFTVKRVGGSYPNFADGNYTVAPGTTWQQFIDSGDAPACLSIVGGRVWHDMNASIMDCGGTLIANTADKKRVKPGDVIIDGATYGCSDYLGYQDHD